MVYLIIAMRVRLLFVLLVFMSCVATATQTASIGVFRHYDTGAILWGGDPSTAQSTLQLERRGVFWYSYVLQTSGYLNFIDVQIHDNDNVQNVYDRLATNPIEDFKYINWGGDWSNHLTPYYPTGHVFLDSDGKPSGVMLNNGGQLSGLPTSPSGDNSYITDPIVYNGTTGRFVVNWHLHDIETGAGSWEASFYPSWGGGIDSSSGSTSSTGSFNPSGSNSGSSGGSFTFPSVSSGGSGGGSVSIPNTTITDSSGSQYQVYNYSDILSAIGGVLQQHALQSHDDLSTINANLQKQLEIDDRGELQVAPTDDTEYSVDYSEAQTALDSVSQWGFNFGMQSNPIGDIFTRILGSPPTNFGSVDQVWDVDFDLGFFQVHSSFSLSDWFPSAFRSCVLMVLSLVFAIAIAKAISGAFS